jgi:hypothetical protein
MSDREQVLEANRAFYKAFESLEVEKMEQVWRQAPHIMCIPYAQNIRHLIWLPRGLSQPLSIWANTRPECDQGRGG